MAIEKTIVINTDTSKAVKGVDNLKKSIKDTGKEVSSTEDATKQLGGSLDSITGGAVSKFKSMTGAIKGMAIGFKGVGMAIAASGLGLLVITIAAIKAAFTSSEEGQNKFAKIMAVIGSVTANLTDLLADLGEKIISVFENPKQAIKDFAELVKKNITNRLDGLLELFPALGKAAKQFFSGDFSGAAETALNATAKVSLGVDGLTDKIKAATEATKEFIAEQQREAEIAAGIADQRAKADKLDRGLITEKAKAERDIAKLRDKASRRDIYNAEQRKQFLIDASNINQEINKKEIESAKIRYEAIKLENEQSDSNKEAKEKEAQAQAKVIQLDTQRLNLQKRLGTEISAINQQEAAASNARIKRKQAESLKEQQEEEKRLSAIDKIKQKFLDSDAENDAKTRQQKLDLEKARAQEDLDLLIGSETEKKEAQLALNALYAQKQAELDETIKNEKFEKDNEERAKEVDEQKKANETLKEEIQSLQDKRNEIAENEELNGLQKATMLFENLATELKINDLSKASLEEKAAFAKNILAASASALGESTAAGKAAAVAATTIDTIQSGVSAYKGMVAAIPGPVGIAAGAVAAAGSLVSGYSSVKKILSVKTPKGGGGGSVPSAPSQPQAPAFNLVGQSGVNQVQDSLQEESTPIQAYVVGSEVTSQQELDRNQQNSASI